MEVNYKELVMQILDVIRRADFADLQVMSAPGISIDEAKRKFAENNELFRLDVCKRIKDAYCGDEE